MVDFCFEIEATITAEDEEGVEADIRVGQNLQGDEDGIYVGSVTLLFNQASGELEARSDLDFWASHELQKWVTRVSSAVLQYPADQESGLLDAIIIAVQEAWDD